jgi:hypothetical protein
VIERRIGAWNYTLIAIVSEIWNTGIMEFWNDGFDKTKKQVQHPMMKE